MESIWTKTAVKPRFSVLEGNKKTDVLIIGGGISGILCAYKLQRLGIDCILAEATEIAGGVTKNTTAKITLGHGLIYAKTAKRFGIDTARLYAEAQMKAINEYSELSKNIDCDFRVRDNYVYSLTDRKKIEKEVETLNRIGINAELSDTPELPFQTAGAVRIREQAQFHPLKFLYELAKELPIYENTKISELSPEKAKTDRGEISYKKLIIATHFPTLNKHGLYPLKLYQHRSYVIALSGTDTVSGMYVDEADTGLSFRTFDGLLLLGGGAHRTGKSGGCWQELEDFAKRHYKSSKTIAKWAAQDCMTLDGLPYVGRYAKGTPNVFVATGWGKWGMTNSMAAADILCDLVQGKSNPYAAVFSPSRSVLRPQLLANAFHSVIGLLTPTVPRCPHLGCALKYNPAEHSWDCPCHGSRFSEDGQLIDNPATDDKTLNS